jgi:hypothetical protein
MFINLLDDENGEVIATVETDLTERETKQRIQELKDTLTDWDIYDVVKVIDGKVIVTQNIYI